MRTKALLGCALTLLILHSVQAATYRLHTVHSGSVASRVRVTNLSDTSGTIEITGFDDRGERYGPVELELEARAAVVLLTRELENSAPDKGLRDGLGDGSGQWQLELTTELEIGAMSFKGGVLSDPLSSAEPVPERALPERFLWAHQFVDKGVRRFLTRNLLSPDKPPVRFNYGGRQHELLSAYDWRPHDEVQGVELGWGDFEYPHAEAEPWTRFGGHLDYTAFAVQYGTIAGEHDQHAYVIGHQTRCNGWANSTDLLPPIGTEWVGAIVFVAPGKDNIGYGPISFKVDSFLPREHGASSVNLAGTFSIYTAENQDSPALSDIEFSFTPTDDIGGEQGGSFFGPGCAEIGGFIDPYFAFGARRVEAVDAAKPSE